VMLKEIKAAQDEQTKMLRAIDERTVTIEQLSTENRKELKRTREVLLKGIFEATEVQTPTLFIILKEKLPRKEDQTRLLSLQLKADGSGFEVEGDLIEQVKEAQERFEEGKTWVERICSFGNAVAEQDVSGAFATIKETLGDLVTAQTMYFYLLDELTGEPVEEKNGIYPIEITKPSDVVPKLLPVMQVGMRAMSLCNGVIGVANMFGAPFPDVPKQWCADAQGTIELLKQESSVEQFGAINEIVMANDNEPEAQTVRGNSLRELHRFFKEKDDKQTFAGLRRVADEDGSAIWTLLTDPAKVKKAIEKRSLQRRAEQQQTEATVQAALKEKASPRVKQAEARARAAETPALSTTTPRAPEPASPNFLSCVARCLAPTAGSQSEVLRRMNELATQQQEQRQVAEQQQQMLAQQFAEQQRRMQEQFAEQQRQLSGLLRPSLDPEATAHHRRSSTVEPSHPGESPHLLAYFKSRSTERQRHRPQKVSGSI